MIKVYLVRHGHVDNGSERRYLGRTDLPLDTFGIQQAKALQDYFKTIVLDMVFTSPLQRCVQTTEIICKAKTIHYETVEAFSEINMGDWEMYLWQRYNQPFLNYMLKEAKI